MKRREFISLVGVSAGVSSLPAITACNSQSTETVASDVRSDGFEVVGSTSELDKTGQLLNEDLAVGKVLVIRPANAKAIAVNPTCTHAGCNVAWVQDQQAFVCPCHDSKFASDGSVQEGPANKPLATYTAKIEGDLVLVKGS